MNHKHFNILGIAIGIIASATLIYMASLNIKYNRLMIAKLEKEKESEQSKK